MSEKLNNTLEYRFGTASPFRTFWRLLADDKWRLLLSLLFFIIKHSPVYVLPIITALIIRLAISNAPDAMSQVLMYLGIMLILTLQNVPSTMVFLGLLNKARRNLEARTRGSLVRRLQQLSITYHHKHPSGRLQAKLMRDVEMVQELLRQLVHGAFASGVSLIYAFGYTLYNKPILALFFLVAGPAPIIIIRLLHKPINKANADLRNSMEVMSGQMAEMIQMVPITRAHAAEEHQIRKIDQTLGTVKKFGLRVDKLDAIFGSACWVVWSIFNLACLGVTTWMCLHEMIKPEDVVLYLLLYEIILGAIGRTLDVFPMISKGMESVKSIAEVLQCPDIELNDGKLALTAVDGNFDFQDVAFQYKESDSTAVADFSLKISKGDTVAFVGESGAGKTTIMSLLIGFHRPTSGKILLDGKDMQDIDLRTYRKHLAVVPQSPILFSGTVRENITFGLDKVKEDDIRQVVEMANATDFISQLPQGLDTPLGENGCRLSGGQKQRIAIARALIRNPKVIIFDEATSALDAQNELLVQQAIEKMILGRTTFIVAHRLSTIRICNKIVVMKGGRCVESGSHEELMSLGGEFQKLKSLQT